MCCVLVVDRAGARWSYCADERSKSDGRIQGTKVALYRNVVCHLTHTPQNIDPDRDELYIFEYDRRFEEVYPAEYVYFDFNEPLDIPSYLQHSFDIIHFDPPYLVIPSMPPTPLFVLIIIHISG